MVLRRVVQPLGKQTVCVHLEWQVDAMSNMETITVALPTELARMIQERVARGDYESESAVVIDALQLFEGEFTPYDDWLRAEVLPVLEACEANPGRLMPAEEVFSRLEARHRRDLQDVGRAS
jgi:antitoxin ParD1/3/4